MINQQALDTFLLELEGELETANEARRQMEYEATGEYRGGYENPRAVLVMHLNKAYELMLMLLEAIPLPQTRSRLIKNWVKLESATDSGIEATHFWQEFDWLESKPYDLLAVTMRGVRLSVGKSPSRKDEFERNKLEMILKDTARLVRKRFPSPSKEAEVQTVMHDFLEAYFADFSQRVRIPGTIKNYEPDCGVRNLKAAIEFKFACIHSELKTSLSGIFEDISGYAGSNDWTSFYSVIYQTEAFDSQARIDEELARIGATAWKVYLVSGTGKRAKADATAKPQVVNS